MNVKKICFPLSILLMLITCACPVFAFSPPRDTVGALTLTIADPGEVKSLAQNISINVTLKNSGSVPLSGTVHLGVIDDWRVTDNSPRAFSLGPNATQTLAFNVVPGKDSFAALYPVHAYADFRSGNTPATAHAILLLSVSSSAVNTATTTVGKSALLKLSKQDRVRLDSPKVFTPAISVQDGTPATKPTGWTGTDEATGASIQLTDVDRGDRRHVIGVHPAWRKGWGDVLLDYHVKLPEGTPAHLDFATAIRDNTATEPASDGVEFRVLVSDGGTFKNIFTRFSLAKRWEPATVDLSAYAGREITLRLVTDPGPAHNTVCDQSYWAEPTLSTGTPPQAEADAQRTTRRQQALQLAHAVFNGKSAPWSWKLNSEAGVTGAAIVPGPNGLADAFIAIVDAQRELVFTGFIVQIDNQNLGSGKTDLACAHVDAQFSNGMGTLTHTVLKGDLTLSAQTIIHAEKGALRVAFAMPGVKRDARGEPRFTTLSIGPASESARRVYAGFGNVIQDPGRFDLHAGGFTLSTRHVGMDFKNGLSLVQACDIFPDYFRVDPSQQLYTLATHHDATLSFIPSTHQAFAAARVYRDIAGFKPAGGVADLLGRVCLDQWGGDYRRAAQDLELAARYGLTNAVFVKHVWQRWGYDYRLPDIYPPAGSFTDFQAMAEACKRNGLLFSPHDNYIDFYPDATGFSYDHILFNADGTPQKAWFNSGRDALSYRWSPIAFGPWLEGNLKQVKAGIAPTAYFVDVFSAMPPIDFYDRKGNFYPKTVTAERWGAAFDRIRELLGNNAPTISEAGQDGLIGHLDSGESDHSGWFNESKIPNGAFRWNMKAGDAERIPWHDMASHGKFVLFAGGLGPRYSGGQDQILHGYASDDYLSLTVLGGRNPMAEGPFSRRTVMTYWLLHDVCAQLAHREILAHEFSGDDIHCQSVQFSQGGSVQVNRSKMDWKNEGQVLPTYGFVAHAGDYTADISRRNGLITAFAQSPGVLFADARPNVSDDEGQVMPHVTSVEDLGNRRFRLHIDWQVLQPVPEGFKPFLHFANEQGANGESILFQGGLNLDPTKLTRIGTYPSTAEVTIPDSVKLPADIGIRFGLYHAGTDGRRLPLLGPLDGTGRARGGRIHAEGKDGQAVVLRWQAEPPDPAINARLERLNLENKLIDFGPVATSGAFRLVYSGNVWELIPLPGSPAFPVELQLDKLNARGQKIQALTAIGLDGKPVGPGSFQQNGNRVQFTTAAKVFAYQLQWAK